MSDLRDLYQSVILDHNKKPRNLRRPDGANRDADGFNPLCGDKVRVYLAVEGDVVKDVGFEGSGCAISTASASLMTEAVKGRRLAEVESLFERFHELVTGPPTAEPDTDALGKLAVFSGVREFPVRVKCATLAWHTLRSAIEGGGAISTTE
jgi:nitrogen fixation NifU-like protein